MTGRSDRHAQALAQGIEEALKKQGVRPVARRGAAARQLGAHGLRRRRRPRLPGRLTAPLRHRGPLARRAAASGPGRAAESDPPLASSRPALDVVLEVELPARARARHRFARCRRRALGPRAIVQPEAPGDVRVSVGIAPVERPPVVQVHHRGVGVLGARIQSERQLAPEHPRVGLHHAARRAARSSPRSRAGRASAPPRAPATDRSA